MNRILHYFSASRTREARMAHTIANRAWPPRCDRALFWSTCHPLHKHYRSTCAILFHVEHISITISPFISTPKCKYTHTNRKLSWMWEDSNADSEIISTHRNHHLKIWPAPLYLYSNSLTCTAPLDKISCLVFSGHRGKGYGRGQVRRRREGYEALWWDVCGKSLWWDRWCGDTRLIRIVMHCGAVSVKETFFIAFA